MRRRLNLLAEADWLAIFLFLVLIVFGWLNIYSVNYNESSTTFFTTSNRPAMQLAWIGISLVLALLIFVTDSRFFSFTAYPLYAFSLAVLLLVIIAGKEVNGSKSWIMIGPVGLQPAEFAKVTTILALARFLSGYNVKANSRKNIFFSFLIIALPPIFIMLQPDFGSTIVYGSLLIVLYREGLSGWLLLLILFMAGIFLASLVFSKFVVLLLLVLVSLLIYGVNSKNKKNTGYAIVILLAALVPSLLLQYLDFIKADSFIVLLIAVILATTTYIILALSKKLKGVVLMVVFLYAFIGFVYSVDFVFHNILQKHQRERVEIMLGLKSDPWGYEYNVNQSKIAIGSGGFTGRGFLQGPQTKLKYVPEQSTDFIFCTIGEEWGFLGSLAFVAVFIGLIIRLIIIAERQRSKFSRIYGYGVVSILFFHFAVNISMTLALFPVIGIPLPFISYGGSSLMSFTVMLFIMLKLDATRKAYLI
ncbi:MAG: rod shape-determining protein RodA [Bacteroidales bacterium]|nr:rod shape-determining protein RodA [Bacteroidales bacterium]